MLSFFCTLAERWNYGAPDSLSPIGGSSHLGPFQCFCSDVTSLSILPHSLQSDEYFDCEEYEFMYVQDYDDKISKEIRMGSAMHRDEDDKDSREHYEICVLEGEAFDEVHVASPESTEEFSEDAIEVALDSLASMSPAVPKHPRMPWKNLPEAELGSILWQLEAHAFLTRGNLHCSSGLVVVRKRKARTLRSFSR